MLLIALAALALVWLTALSVVVGLCAHAARGDRALLAGRSAVVIARRQRIRTP
jgi:hypothetical protein